MDSSVSPAGAAPGLEPRHWQRHGAPEHGEREAEEDEPLQWTPRGAGFEEGRHSKLVQQEDDYDEGEEEDAVDEEEERHKEMERASSASKVTTDERGADDSADQFDGGYMGRLEGGGERTEVTAEDGPERVDQTRFLVHEGFQFASLQSFRGEAAHDNGTLTKAAESSEPLCILSRAGDTWIDDDTDDDCDYGALPIDDSSIFEEAVRELLKSSQAAKHALAMTEEDDHPRLDTAPPEEALNGSHFSAVPMEVDDVSAHEQAVDSMQGVGTASSFDYGGLEVAAVSGPAAPAQAMVDLEKSGEDCFDGPQRVVGGTDLPYRDMHTATQLVDLTFSEGRGSDGVCSFSHPMVPAQEPYSSSHRNSDSLLAAVAESLGRGKFDLSRQGVVDHAPCTSLEAEGILQRGEKSFSELLRDGGSPLNGEQSEDEDIVDLEDILPNGSEMLRDDGSLLHGEQSQSEGMVDLEHILPSASEGGCDASAPHHNGYAVPSPLKDEFLETGSQISPVPGPSSSETETVVAADGTRGQFDGNASEDLGSGAAPIDSNSRDADDASRDEEHETQNQDEGVGAPLWVKWRGKWEAAIRCRVSDCPITTLKARPKYSKKKYVVVYFPSARLLSWVDTQHTCPISENPVPLLNGTHSSGRESVKDDALPRRRMLLKLGAAMCDVSDRLHLYAVVESSRDVRVWKAFAEEAAAATTYAEVGSLLIKLHLAIAPRYIKPAWMERRHARWKDDCKSASIAASIQKLTKELVNGVLWEDVQPLWNAPEQPELDSEWEHWKGEAFEEKDSEDEKHSNARSSSVSGTGAVKAGQVTVPAESKRFKQQARAKQWSRLHADQLTSFEAKHPDVSTLGSSPKKLSRVHAVSVNSSGGQPITAFRSPLVHISPSWKGKGMEESGEILAHNSGLCSAFLKTKNRRCHRPAKADIIYCGKHKHLATAKHVGEDLASDSELAWWSGLCSASVGREATRCAFPAAGGTIFCKIHVHLATDQAADRSGDDAVLLVEVRCSGVTGRGVQCTHKAKDGSSFCVKHCLQSTNGQDHMEGEIYDLLRWTEGSASKKRRVDQVDTGIDTGRTASTPLEVPIFPAGNLHADLGPGGSGSIEGTVVVSTEMKPVEINAVQRKRKWVSRDSTRIVQCVSAQGHGDIRSKGANVRTSKRCQGITKSGEPCSFRAPVGQTLCAKHVMTAEDQRSIPMEDSRVSGAFMKANLLFQRYLNSAERIYSGVGDGTSINQLLHQTREEAAQNRNVAEKLLKMVTMEMSRLQTLSHPAEATETKKRAMSSDFLSREPVHDQLLEDHDNLLEPLCCEHGDKPTGPSQKNDELLNGAATSVAVDIAEILECNSCHEEFHSHLDLLHHKENSQKCVEVEVNGPSASSSMDEKHIHMNHFDSHSEPQLFERGSLGSSSLLPSAKAHWEARYSPNCKPGTGQGEIFGKRAVISGPSRWKLAAQRKPFSKVGCSDQTVGGKGMNKKKLLNLLDRKNMDKKLDMRKEPLLARMKAAVLTAQLRSLGQLKHDATEFEERKMEVLQEDCSNTKSPDSKHDAIILCSDLSNGQEPVPIVCLVERDVVESWTMMQSNDGGSSSDSDRPWDTFSYITKRVLDPSLGLDPEDYKVGCSCGENTCLPESCEHVHIFDNDNLDALDIYGTPMKGRFPYDEKGCIILEEGYLVYECNSSCRCLRTCQNRVLQKGVMVRLEVFRTSQKGWAVRAAEKIPRGTFVCEYIGEVLHDQEANKRGERYDQVGCSYLYDIDAHLDITGKAGCSKPFVIDATKVGNVARFINHSCAPNLLNYQVLVDSMDCQLAHIGLFASQDIECGEELAYDYRYKLLPGKGCLCHCGAENCRGRLY